MARLGRLGLGRTAFKATLVFFMIMALIFLGPFRVVFPRALPVGKNCFGFNQNRMNRKELNIIQVIHHQFKQQG